jgi:hypothetical protein
MRKQYLVVVKTKGKKPEENFRCKYSEDEIDRAHEAMYSNGIDLCDINSFFKREVGSRVTLETPKLKVSITIV